MRKCRATSRRRHERQGTGVRCALNQKFRINQVFRDAYSNLARRYITSKCTNSKHGKCNWCVSHKSWAHARCGLHHRVERELSKREQIAIRTRLVWCCADFCISHLGVRVHVHEGTQIALLFAVCYITLRQYNYAFRRCTLFASNWYSWSRPQPANQVLLVTFTPCSKSLSMCKHFFLPL